jgi:hypothetical protein
MRLVRLREAAFCVSFLFIASSYRSFCNVSKSNESCPSARRSCFFYFLIVCCAVCFTIFQSQMRLVRLREAASRLSLYCLSRPRSVGFCKFSESSASCPSAQSCLSCFLIVCCVLLPFDLQFFGVKCVSSVAAKLLVVIPYCLSRPRTGRFSIFQSEMSLVRLCEAASRVSFVCRVLVPIVLQFFRVEPVSFVCAKLLLVFPSCLSRPCTVCFAIFQS